MSDLISELFDDFAVRQARGEYPDPLDYLDRAGVGADELAEMLDLFVQWAPAPTPDPLAVQMMKAWLAGEPPLLTLRVDKGLRVDEIVDTLATELGVETASRSKLRRYVLRLEGGLLDASRVNERVFDVLSPLLGAPRSLLVAWSSPPRATISAAPAYRGADVVAGTPSRPAVPDVGSDAVDELFLGAGEP